MTRNTKALRTVELTCWAPTPENFAAFGELIQPAPHGKEFGPDEAQLDLSQGQPRLYLMRSPFHGLSFTRITRHQRVTQCLGARQERDWYIAVAPPDPGRDMPLLETIVAFHIPPDTAIKLHRGSWHAGPFFRWDFIDFYNLELVDTNQIDSDHAELDAGLGVRLVFAWDEHGQAIPDAS